MNRIVLLFLVFSIALGCKNESKDSIPEDAINPAVIENPATASSDPSTAKDNVPVLKFENDTHNFGTIVQGEKISYAYKFTNVGKAPLVIRSAQGSCGCTVPEFPKDPVAPGESGIINVTFNSEGKQGHQDKTVTIISNTMPNTYTLYVVGDVTVKE